jgi:hypothetical protein
MTKTLSTSAFATIPANGGGHRIIAGVTPLTAKQQAILDVAWTYWHEHGELVSVRKLTALLGLTATQGTTDHIRAIERRGIYFPRVGHPVPHTDDPVTDTVEVERLRSLYWMHMFEASTGRAVGSDRSTHRATAEECFRRLKKLDKDLVSRPLEPEEKNE